MIRTLLIIAVAGLVLATASLAGAFALGGRDMAREGWEWTLHDPDGDTVSFQRRDGTEPASVTREMEWTGGQRLTVDLPGRIDYVQGAEPGVVVTGPAELTERVRLVDGRLFLAESDGATHERVYFGRKANGRGFWVDSDDLEIVVTAPNVNDFELQGSAYLTLRDYDQDSLTLDISGSGEVTASGKTRTMELDISGSGDADLHNLTLTDANVAIAGSGEAALAPTGRVDVSISGSGDVDLLTRPAQLNQNISGSGDVEVGGGRS